MNQKEAELLDYIFRSEICGMIKRITLTNNFGKVSASEIVFTDWRKAIQILSRSPQFINANLGYLHDAELGEPCFDFRSITNGNNCLGNLSLQINIGKTSGRARADLDKFNPVQDLSSFIGHIGEVLQIF